MNAKPGVRAWLLALVVAGLALAAPAAAAAAAERAWVKGEVRLNIRSGAGTQYRIIGGVQTGDALDVLERRPNWIHVRGPDGKDGWIPEGYLAPEPPPTSRLAQLEKDTVELQSQLEKISGEAEQLRTRNQALAGSDEERRAKLARLERENVGLRAGARWPHWITGALILSTGMALGAILSRVSARGRRQRIRL